MLRHTRCAFGSRHPDIIALSQDLRTSLRRNYLLDCPDVLCIWEEEEELALRTFTPGKQARDLQRQMFSNSGHNEALVDSSLACPGTLGLGEPFGSCKRIWAQRPPSQRVPSVDRLAQNVLHEVTNNHSISAARAAGDMSDQGDLSEEDMIVGLNSMTQDRLRDAVSVDVAADSAPATSAAGAANAVAEMEEEIRIERAPMLTRRAPARANQTVPSRLHTTDAHTNDHTTAHTNASVCAQAATLMHDERREQPGGAAVVLQRRGGGFFSMMVATVRAVCRILTTVVTRLKRR